MQWCTLCTVLEYYDTFETLAIRDIHELWPVGHNPISLGGQGNDLIIASDLVLRTDMFRINTLQPTLAGGEVMASVLTSACCCDPTVKTHYHAAHLPTHHQLVASNRRNISPAVPKSAAPSATPRRVDYADEICRLFLERELQVGRRLQKSS